MAQAKFNSDGTLVNAETGEPIGDKKGNSTTINSAGAEMYSLEDYGVLLPDFPEESHEEKDEDEDFNMSNSSIAKQDGQESSSDEDKGAGHMDNGVSSFRVKRTKYEVTKDSYFIVRFGLMQKEDGRFVPVKYTLISTFPSCEPHWVKFRMWNYGEELQWKSKFIEYNSNMKMQEVNKDKLDEYKIRHLMLDWSFGEYDDRLKLLHCDGVLSDESYGIFMGMYPSIASTIVDLMNLVLESNQ